MKLTHEERKQIQKEKRKKTQPHEIDWTVNPIKQHPRYIETHVLEQIKSEYQAHRNTFPESKPEQCLQYVREDLEEHDDYMSSFSLPLSAIDNDCLISLLYWFDDILQYVRDGKEIRTDYIKE